MLPYLLERQHVRDGEKDETYSVTNVELTVAPSVTTSFMPCLVRTVPRGLSRYNFKLLYSAETEPSGLTTWNGASPDLETSCAENEL